MFDMAGARRAGAAANAWPYPWVWAPPGAVSFFAHGSFAAPAYGANNQIVLCEYDVKQGWEGVLTDVMVIYSDPNGTWIEGSGDILFDIDIDRPLGNPLSTGRFLPDYHSILTQLGDLQQPWPVRGGWRMKQDETYRVKAQTVQNVTIGSPAFMHGALLGWVWPMSRTQG
jgi:hypothetical protein